MKLTTKPSTESCPKRNRNSIWWTLELKTKRSKTRALRRQYQKEYEANNRQIKKEAFKKTQAENKKLIIKTKQTKFKEFIINITTSSCFGQIFKIITEKKKRAHITTQIMNFHRIHSKNSLSYSQLPLPTQSYRGRATKSIHSRPQ
ncbi:hypothetical protein CDAR_299801 [Caerostris darwini]|uniref:Uncharacterized protein n=1 Tax=Caerostris darwini TaxID=1538125 RepID=A0AAV4UQ06_9ARAC|nr:hypothetical protein CDAR_299801 [Caerostris darwini]